MKKNSYKSQSRLWDEAAFVIPSYQEGLLTQDL